MGRLSQAVVVLLLLVGLSEHVEAQPRVVVAAVRGPGGGRIAAVLRRGLGSRFRLVSAQAFSRAARRGGGTANAAGRSFAARELRVTTVISGSISRAGHRWMLRLLIFSGHDGELAGVTRLALRGNHLAGGSLQLTLKRIEQLMRRARMPVGETVVHRPRTRHAQPVRSKARASRSAPRQVPAVQPMSPAVAAYAAPKSTPDSDADLLGEDDEDAPARDADDLGFTVAEADEEVTPRGRGGRATDQRFQEMFRIKRDHDERPSWETIIEASAGVMALSRRMSFDYPEGVGGIKGIPAFRSGVVAGIHLEAAVFPLAHLRRGPLTNLGIVGRYYRALNIKYYYLPEKEPLRTTLHTFEIGLRYRWNFLGRETSPTLNLGVEFGRMAFVVWDEANVAADHYLPRLAYLYLKLSLARLEVPLFARNGLSFGLGANVDYLQILSTGPISQTDEGGVGPQSRSGVEVGGGVFGSYRGFFARVSGFYRHIFYNFNDTCGQKECGGSARDVYSGVLFSAGYAY